MAKNIPCGALLKQLNDKLEKDANNALRAQGLTMVQSTALVWLSECEGKQAPLKELERQLGVAQSTAAGITVRLEQKGFVESFGDANDRRVKMVHLTAKGEQSCITARQNMQDTEVKLLASLTEEEKTVFHQLLQKVRNNFK